MLKRYILRWERNWILERESGKKEHLVVVGELGNVLVKVLIDFGKLFQRIGAVWLNERFIDILRKQVEGQSRVRWSEKRVEWVGLIFLTFTRYWGWEVWKRSSKRDDFVLDNAPLFCASAEIWVQGDMFSFGGFSYWMSKEVLQEARFVFVFTTLWLSASAASKMSQTKLIEFKEMGH